MNYTVKSQQYVGTLIGPHGELVGEFIRYQDAHNEIMDLQLQIERLKANQK